MINISRLGRKNRSDLNLLNTGNVFDLFDNEFKVMFRVNDEEYDYICENTSGEELDILIGNKNTKINYTQAKLIIKTLEELLYKYTKRWK